MRVGFPGEKPPPEVLGTRCQQDTAGLKEGLSVCLTLLEESLNTHLCMKAT